MRRALVISLATLAISLSLSLAQQTSETAGSWPSQPAPKTVPAVRPSPTPHEDPAAEQELLDLANQRRREIGAPALRMDARLTDAARAHALLMVDRQQLSHQFDGEPSLMPRLLETGLSLDHVGENVAYNASSEKAFEALMQSPPHRRNLLDPNFNSAGFAAVWSNGRLYVVQDFAHQRPGLIPTSVK